MPTKEEIRVDKLIAEYDAYRSMHPKQNLPEVTPSNRDFLIACVCEKTGEIRNSEKITPEDGYVLFGGWHNLGKYNNKKFLNITWYKCQLTHDFNNLNLTNSNFIQCKLSNTNLINCNLTGTTFEKCTFIRERMLGVFFEDVRIIRPVIEHYNPINDDLDEVRFGWISWLFDWSKLRFFSAIPMFSISWSTLLGSLVIMNTIGWGSANREKLSSVVEPLSMPPTLIELFIAACFMAAAATLYAFYCPPRIKEISETEWADKQSNPRLQYFAHRFPYRWRERVAIILIYIFGAIGLVLTGKLVIERGGSAYCFTTNWETPERCVEPQLET